MGKIQIVLKCAFIVVLLVVGIEGKDWSGIFPLQSTRKDTEQILGKPKWETSNDAFFELKNENVLITFAQGDCQKYPYDWNVFEGTVQEIFVYPKEKLTLDNLELNLSKYRKSLDVHYRILHYLDDENGFRITANESDKRIMHFAYYPSLKNKAKNMRCSD